MIKCQYFVFQFIYKYFFSGIETKKFCNEYGTSYMDPPKIPEARIRKSRPQHSSSFLDMSH